jgi:hypothetical protein
MEGGLCMLALERVEGNAYTHHSFAGESQLTDIED